MTMQKAHHVVHNPLSAMNPRKRVFQVRPSKSVLSPRRRVSLSPRRRALPSLLRSQSSHSAPKTVTRSAKNVMRIGGIDRRRPSTATRVAKRGRTWRSAAKPACSEPVRSAENRARKTDGRPASTRKTGGSCLQNWVDLHP
jgi:hypothetical protein